jgi:hypothetical protein
MRPAAIALFHWTRLSCRRFRDDEGRLHLHAQAYNLATYRRCIELPEAMADWSPTSDQLEVPGLYREVWKFGSARSR